MDQPTTGVPTVVWMANRDAPINGKYLKFILFEDGNLALTDAEQYIIWSTHTKSTSSISLQLQLHDTYNLILFEREQSLWQSFDYPIDTLLPDQPLTTNRQLVSSRSSTSYASCFYKLFFDDYDSILRLHYEDPVSTRVFWHDPRFLHWEVGRYQYVYNRRASLNSDGEFKSSDGLEIFSFDYGIGPQRMMKIEIDGNLRVYGFIEHQTRKEWKVQWQVVSRSYRVHGICGPNSLCTYSHDAGRRCIYLHGYKMVNSEDVDLIPLVLMGKIKNRFFNLEEN
ncbi:unnamed protein product [Lactuca virosa]|uniref:Bulb-type lectin domain-containing protein n=1 Tax=Lactuca virosa TaxID=75947 RepID=A0AAU9N7P2_9ASTR|nr:unnamed protein product [Lactuca virosa]